MMCYYYHYWKEILIKLKKQQQQKQKADETIFVCSNIPQVIVKTNKPKIYIY